MASNKVPQRSVSAKDEMIQYKDPNEIIQENDDAVESTMNIENKMEVVCSNKTNKLDLEIKMIIVYNVLKACIDEQNINDYCHMDDMIKRMAFLTSLDTCTLLNIFHKKKLPEKQSVFDENVPDTPDLDYSIRQLLIKKYVKRHKIPNTACFFNIFKNYKCRLHQQLKISGYIWHRLPNTKRAIIMEHPERVISRQRYLRQIFRVRQEKRPIIYIESKVLSMADKNIAPFKHYLTGATDYVMVFIAVDNVSGFKDAHVFVLKSILRCQKVIENHVIKNCLPTITKPSIIILEEKMYYTKSLPVPSIESEKSEMMKWLKVNGIPHEENLHRSELFELIEKCTIKDDLHNFDTIVCGLGHKILRRPPRTEYLNFFKPIWENLSASENATEFMSNRSLKFWKNLDIKLRYMERVIFKEDLAVEGVIDQILTMANDVDVKNWADEECDVQYDSLAQEELIVHHKTLS